MQRKQLWILAIIAALVLGLSLWWVLGSDKLDEAGDDESAEQGEAGAEGGEPGREGPRFATPELEREPKSAVAGIVRGEGEPVAGARVCVWAEDRDRLAGRDPKNPRCTLSEADGHYRIEGLWPVASEVHASAEGFIPAKWSEHIEGVGTSYAVLMRPGEAREDLDFDLRPGGAEVRGVVKDIAGGEIEGAVVWVRPSGFVIDKGSAMGVTDENGAFRLWAAEGRARVGAKVEGYADANVNTTVPGPTVEVFMVPESAISGRVVYAGSGEPAAGVELEAGASRFFGGGGGTARSDEQGNFRVGGLEAGVYTLSARGDEVYGEGGELIHLGLAETETGVVVEVHPARHIEGEIVIADGAEGRPCEIGGVELIDSEDEERRIRGGIHDRDGKVSLGAVLPGTYEVKVNCRGYVSEDSYEDLVVGEDNLVGLKWEVREGLAMRGVVLDGAGEPVEGATVYAKMRVDADDPRKRTDRELARPSDVEGNFEILGVLPGTYELDILDMTRFGMDDEPLVVELEPGADINDLRIELPARGVVFGTIRDAQGEPVPRAIIRATPVGSWGGPRGISDDSGAFRLEDVDAGEVRVTASDGRMSLRAPGTSDDDEQGELVKVVAGEEVEVNLVVEAQGASIRGQVLDESGAPVSDAFVSAQRMTDSVTAGKGAGKRRIRWTFNNQPVLTDQDGRFVIDDLSADATYVIGAFRKGGGEAVEEGVQSGGEVELTIVDTGELAGKVVVEGGEAPERFTVTVDNREEGLQRSDELFRTGGAFRMKELPPGTYVVQVKSPSGSATLEDIKLEGGEVRDDLVLKLQPRVTVRGRFVDLVSGEPVPGMRASIGPRTGPTTFFGSETGDNKDISGADGAFVVEEAVSGKVRLTARPRNFTNDAKYSWTSVLLEIPAEAGEHDLGDIELVADRVESGGNAGDLGYELKQADLGTKAEELSHEVALVRDGGPAQAAGLEVGAVIVSVDGHSVLGEDRYRYGKLTAVPKGTTIELGLEGGESVKITAGPPRD